jgi:hypothetical protein
VSIRYVTIRYGYGIWDIRTTTTPRGIYAHNNNPKKGPTNNVRQSRSVLASKDKDTHKVCPVGRERKEQKEAEEKTKRVRVKEIVGKPEKSIGSKVKRTQKGRQN